MTTTPSSPRQVTSCGVMLFRSPDAPSFLVLKHGERLDLPKGHLHDDEQELECALRELREETGLLPEQLRLVEGFRHVISYTTRYKRFGGSLVHKQVIVFLAWLRDDLEEEPVIRLGEHVSFDWLPWSEPPPPTGASSIDEVLLAVAEHGLVEP